MRNFDPKEGWCIFVEQRGVIGYFLSLCLLLFVYLLVMQLDLWSFQVVNVAGSFFLDSQIT
jgi:hypothetical protein